MKLEDDLFGPNFKIKTMKLGKTRTRVLIPVGEISNEEFQERMDKVLTNIVKRMEGKNKRS